MNTLCWKNVTEKATFGVMSTGAPVWMGFQKLVKPALGPEFKVLEDS